MANVGTVRPFQLYEGKWHSGLTFDTHIKEMFKAKPYYASMMIERMFESSWGDDIISHVNNFPTFVAEQKEYRWVGIGMGDKNIALVASWEDKEGTVVAGTSTPYIGANGTLFYLDFNEKFFGNKQIIVGNKPDLYRVWIMDEPKMTSNGIYRYQCQLIGSDGIYIPKDEVKAGTRWSGDGGLVSDYMSRDGFGVNQTSPFEFENRMSQFRMEQEVPGSSLREGKYGDVYMFKFKDPDTGDEKKVWFEAFWYKFLFEARKNRAFKFLYDKSNKLQDGSTINRELSGFSADSGSGLEELMSAGNRHVFNPNGLTVDYLVKTILDASVTKVPEDKRDITITAGEYGLVMLNKMLQKELGASAYMANLAYMGDTSGRAYDWNKKENSVFVNFGQVRGFAHVNGIRVKFMHSPHKDNPVRNKLMYGEGGRAASYEFDIMDFGTTSGKPNIQKVELKGQPDIFAHLPGIRSAFGSDNGSANAPKMVASKVDADTLMFMSWIGAIIWNPTKIIQFKPSILYT